MPQRAWLIILAELAVIVAFAAGFYSEYLNNAQFQTYVNGLTPVLVPVLSVAFGVSSAAVAIFLYLGMRKVSETQGTAVESKPKRQAHPKRTGRKAQSVSEPKTAKSTGESTSGVPRPRFIITGPAPPETKTETSSGKKEQR